MAASIACDKGAADRAIRNLRTEDVVTAEVRPPGVDDGGETERRVALHFRLKMSVRMELRRKGETEWKPEARA